MASIFQNVVSFFGGSGLPKTPTDPFEEKGSSGTAVFGGYVQTRERNSKLIGQQKWITAADLLANISIIATGTRYFLNLVARPSWSLESSDDSAEAKKYVELLEEVMGAMVSPWSRIIRRGALYKFHGFNVQEWTAVKLPSGIIGYADIEVRPAHTVELWDVDFKGTVKGIWQQTPQTGERIYLPRRKLIYLVDDVLTDSPEGMGWFRHLVDPGERLNQLLKLEGIGYERDLAGTPIGRAPLSEINVAVKNNTLRKEDAVKMIEGLSNFVKLQVKKPETGIVLDSQPYKSLSADGYGISGVPQWGIDLLTGTNTSIQYLDNAIQRINREMAMIIGVEGILLGSDGSGSLALSKDKTNNLYLQAESTLSDMREMFQKDFIDPIWILNGWPEEYKPRFKTESISFKDVTEITAALREMATAGAVLSPDDEAINDVRDLLGIPHTPEIDPELQGIVRRQSLGLPAEDDNQAVEKYNPNRHPAGSPQGGQFAPAEGGGGSSGGGSGGGSTASLEDNVRTKIKLELAGNLDYSKENDMHTAILENQKGWNASLSREQKAAVAAYQTKEYELINSSIRAGLPSKKAEVLKKSLDETKLSADVVGYRGIHSGFLPSQNPKDLVGMEFIDKGFVSTSTAITPATNFIRNSTMPGVMVIKLPKGTKAAALDRFKPELEVVVQAGSRFRITSAIRTQRRLPGIMVDEVLVLEVEHVGYLSKVDNDHSIEKYNPNRHPAGSPQGGQFAPAEGGGSGDSGGSGGDGQVNVSDPKALESHVRDQIAMEQGSGGTFDPSDDDYVGDMRDLSGPEGLHSKILQEQESWRDDLSDEESSAIDRFQGNAYEKINEALREGDYDEDADAIVGVLDRSALSSDLIGYRGVHTGFLPSQDPTELVGREFTEKGFTSVSTSITSATQFARSKAMPGMMAVSLPKGTKAAALDNFRNELEVVVQAGSRYRIVSATKTESHLPGVNSREVLVLGVELVGYAN